MHITAHNGTMVEESTKPVLEFHSNISKHGSRNSSRTRPIVNYSNHNIQQWNKKFQVYVIYTAQKTDEIL